MGLFENMFGSGKSHSKIKKKIEETERSRTNLKQTTERESKASRIAKEYGVSVSDAREYLNHEERREKGKENIKKIRTGIKAVSDWKRKHIIPFDAKKKRGSVLTWGK